MRDKVVARLKKLLETDGGFDEGYEEIVGFPVPQSATEIDALTDEQLIQLLEIYGAFLG
jgi:hypothetical protein